METTIPFSGFYNSYHDQELDNTLEQEFSDSAGDPIDSLVSKAFDLVDWQSVHNDYAKEYTENFAEEFELKTLKFKLLSSPREYNFTTDRIFCDIALSEVERIFNRVNKETLKEVIKNNFTSRSGFISHYPNNLEDWPTSLEDWDHNHIGTLIQAFILGESDNFDGYAELNLMERSVCNGDISFIIQNNMKGEEAARLFKIANYLRTREDRKYR